MRLQRVHSVGKARVMGLSLQRHLSFQERQIVASFSDKTHNFRYSPQLLDPRVSISRSAHSRAVVGADGW
jgi:hypothetical protein